MTNGHIGIRTVGFTFLTGLLIDGITGMLCAPQSGARTRRQIANFAEGVKEQAGGVAEDATGAMDKMVDNGRRFINV